jgi:peroxiredoxin family protein
MNMANEEQKKTNQIRLVNLALLSLAAGAWDTLGESAFSFSGPMGHEVLKVMEKEMGLEIAGEDAHSVMMEISRIFVDEFGFASSIEVEEVAPDHFQLKVRNCVNRSFTDKLMAAGVEKPFICPILNACSAAMRRMGYKYRGDVNKWVEGNGSIIEFKGI